MRKHSVSAVAVLSSTLGVSAPAVAALEADLLPTQSGQKVETNVPVIVTLGSQLKPRAEAYAEAEAKADTDAEDEGGANDQANAGTIPAGNETYLAFADGFVTMQSRNGLIICRGWRVSLAIF